MLLIIPLGNIGKFKYLCLLLFLKFPTFIFAYLPWFTVIKHKRQYICYRVAITVKLNLFEENILKLCIFFSYFDEHPSAMKKCLELFEVEFCSCAAHRLNSKCFSFSQSLPEQESTRSTKSGFGNTATTLLLK